LPLGFHSESASYFLKGDLDLPTPHKPTHNREWILGEIRTEQGLWVEALWRIPDQYPADGHG
jgi:hypothetical protein